MKLHFSGFEAAIETLDFQFLYLVHNILQILFAASFLLS